MNGQCIVPGVAFCPHWYTHGSVFVYDGREDVWAELRMDTGTINNKWVRIIAEKTQEYEVNSVHPVEGHFQKPGMLWGTYDFNIKDSLVMECNNDKNKAICVIPGVCFVYSWWGLSRVYIYKAEDDTWIEIEGPTDKKPCCINGVWKRAGPLTGAFANEHDLSQPQSME